MEIYQGGWRRWVLSYLGCTGCAGFEGKGRRWFELRRKWAHINYILDYNWENITFLYSFELNLILSRFLIAPPASQYSLPSKASVKTNYLLVSSPCTNEAFLLSSLLTDFHFQFSSSLLATCIVFEQIPQYFLAKKEENSQFLFSFLSLIWKIWHSFSCSFKTTFLQFWS